jgi:drug/metabolite transporter (DMT)-like permease
MNQGIKYILLASFFFSIINVLVKYLSAIPSIEIVFFRSLVTIVLSSITIYKLKLKIFSEHTPLLIGRGLSGAIALSLYFYTIQHMPLATAVTLLYLAPIITIILAIFLLKEKPNKKQIPFFILCFIGAGLMKSFDLRVTTLHFIMGLASAFFAALAYNFIRMLKGKVHHSVVIFYFPLISIPFCLPWLFTGWVNPNFYEFLCLLAIGICTQIAQVYMTKAYMLEKAARISHYNYMTSFWALITGVVLFNEHLNAISLIGIFIIFIGIVFSTKYAPKT